MEADGDSVEDYLKGVRGVASEGTGDCGVDDVLAEESKTEDDCETTENSLDDWKSCCCGGCG